MHYNQHPAMKVMSRFFLLHHRIVMGFFFGCAVSVACFFGYRWYLLKKQGDAQEYFITCTEEYQSALTRQSNWVQIASLFEHGALVHSGVAWTPYFHAYHAQALMHEGNHEQAINAMDRAIALTSSKNPLHSLYTISHALMVLDSDKEEQHQAAVLAIKKIAETPTNNFNDMALFYYGYYYWQKNDFPLAYAQWQELVQKNREQRENPSLWAQAAEPFLEQINIS